MGLLQRCRFVGVSANDLPPRVCSALAQLAEAYEYAQDADRDLWDFAVEIRQLVAAGLTASDLRWLVCKGYVEHAREIPSPDGEDRKFRPGGKLKFGKRTCFVLTAAGLALAGLACGEVLADDSPGVSMARPGGNGRAESLLPRWDDQLRELCFGAQLIKRYKLPAPNQEAILSAFQEESWPPRIDDPLPPRPEQDPKRRLHDTIKCLNRCHKSRVIHFQGDGTGEGVRWEALQRRFSGRLQ